MKIELTLPREPVFLSFVVSNRERSRPRRFILCKKADCQLKFDNKMQNSFINAIDLQRCPDCGRSRPAHRDLCLCGFMFPPSKNSADYSLRKKLYRNFWRTNYRRKNTISFIIILLGILVILYGFHLEHHALQHKGNPEYFKVREQYLGSDRYFLSSEDETLKTASVFKMVGVIIVCVGLIAILSQWLIRPMNANSAKHDKYQW